MIKYILATAFFTILLSTSYSQYSHIIHNGEINYELKVNRYERAIKLLGSKSSGSKYREYLLTLQNNKFFTRNYTLRFTESKSAYQLLGTSGDQDFIDLLIGVPTISLWRNLEIDSIFMTKRYSQDEFFIVDKPESVVWKYTDERMDIAGYECRRVNGLIMDSIYVVAFYSPEIAPGFGPSQFSGLPGMILGVSLPQEHIHIFATQVTPRTIREGTLKPEKTNNRRFKFEELEKLLKSIVGDRFEKDQWDINRQGIRF